MGRRGAGVVELATFLTMGGLDPPIQSNKQIYSPFALDGAHTLALCAGGRPWRVFFERQNRAAR